MMGVLSNSPAIDLVLIITALLYLIYYYLTSTYSYWRDRGVSFAQPTLLFGNFKDNLLGRLSIIDIHNNIYNQFEGERFIGYFIMRKPLLMIKDPELIEKVLIKDFSHFHDRGMPIDPEYEPLTMNLFNARGLQWRNLRYKLMPTFSTGKLKGMFEQICNCGEDLVQELQRYVESGEEVEAKTILSLFTTDVIATCAFGLQMKAGSQEGITFRKMLNKIFAPTVAQILRFNFRSFYPNLSRFFGVTTFGKDVNDYFLKISKASIRMREQEGIKRNDFLQLLMNLKQKEQSGKEENFNFNEELTEEDKLIDQLDYISVDKQQLSNDVLFTDDCIAAQSFVFLTAGSDSTSGALSYVLYAIAKNPAVQLRVQAEIDQVLLTHGCWSYNTFKDMTYLDQVIQEGMRMFPIASFLSRDCTIPYQLPGTDIVLEKGQRISIPVPALHMDPCHYPHPEIFDPERFRNNNYRPSATYLPFGDGPRICIAMRFAVLEMKICLARIFSQYSVSLGKKTQHPLRYVPGSFIPQAIGGIWLNFHEKISKA